RSVRAVLWGGALVAIISALLVAFAYQAVVETLTRQHVALLDEEVAVLATFAEQTSPAALAATLAKPTNRLFRVEDASGSVLAGTLGPAPDEAGGGARNVYRLQQDVGALEAGTLIARVNVALRSGGSVSVARALTPVTTFSKFLLTGFLIGLTALVALVALMASATSRRTRRRIAELTQASEEIMAGDLKRRLAVSRNQDEIDELACAVNRMLDRIGDLMTGLKDVSDNIAHDLKTPLNRMRARTESVLRSARSEADLRDGLEQTIDDADGLIRTFNAMLVVARLEAGAVARSFEAFDLSALASDVVELYAPLADEQGSQLNLAAADGCLIDGNRNLITQVATNLLENALKYGRPANCSKRQTIDVEVRRERGRVVLTVSDNGPGIPVSDRARALDRFGRLEASRTTPGSGLGLSLVRAIAGLHGATLALEANNPGLRVVVTFDAAATKQTPIAQKPVPEPV
ncbi:MAG: ATP-binding protein, partial [Pseudomonadota bacterium]